eukprot:Gregarina_sp_Poly_1__4066@NODE_2234_length_2432_cov_7_434249_g1435_i0_p1_GENE_NODE_2234_length_2432_cov_7_434249_g1435_i0NODE_2234_length_2432_cov_7_434249_g1435_i0_p1_ORF_typecomplete_len755_score80_03DUF4529/PF15032_6/0_038_NODE_2234_length_2432_cov_7_434249_g1435_i0362300
MRNIRVQNQSRSNGVTLSNVLVGCGQILCGTGTRSFKCLSEDQAHDALQICQALEGFKTKDYVENLDDSNNVVEIVDSMDYVPDRVACFTGRELDYEGYEFIDCTEETHVEEGTNVEERSMRRETDTLMSLMKSKELIIIPPLHGDIKENREKFYKCWEAFVKDQDIRQRIFNMVKHESKDDNQTNVLADVFLKYQQLFMRSGSHGTESTLDPISEIKQGLFETIVPSQFRPIAGSMEPFQLFFKSATRRDAAIFSKLGEIETIKTMLGQQAVLLEGKWDLMKDLTQFSEQLNKHCITNSIEDCINLEFLDKCKKPHAVLCFYTQLFDTLRPRMGCRTAQCQLPLIRVLYICLRMVAKAREGLLQKGVQTCAAHQDVVNISFPAIESEQHFYTKILWKHLERVFAHGVDEHNRGKAWDYSSSGLAELYERGRSALVVNKDCFECDLKVLKKKADMPVKLKLEAVTDRLVRRPSFIRKRRGLQTRSQMGQVSDDERPEEPGGKSAAIADETAHRTAKSGNRKIERSYQNLLKELSDKRFDTGYFLKLCKDLVGPDVHNLTQSEGQYLTPEEVSEIQKKIFSIQSTPQAIDVKVYDLCHYLNFMKMDHEKLPIGENLPKVLKNGLTFPETLAFLVEDCNNVAASKVEVGLRLECARNILAHLDAVSRCYKTDPFKALRARIELIQPLMQQENQDSANLIVSRLKGVKFNSSEESHRALRDALDKIAFRHSTPEDLQSALNLVKKVVKISDGNRDLD